MNRRLTGVLIATAVLLTTGLSTGSRIYYLVAILLLALCLISLVSVACALLTLKVAVQSGQARVTRGTAMNLVFSVSHASILPVGEIRLSVGLTPGGMRAARGRRPAASARRRSR